MVRVLASAALLAAAPVCASAADRTFDETVRPLLAAHCIKCHGPEKQSGDVRLDDLTAATGKDAARWAMVRDQLRDGLMPPRKEPRPDTSRVQAAITWTSAALGAKPARLPNQGNLIPHELLFGPASEGPRGTDQKFAGSPARLWRLSPEAYLGFVRDVHRGRGDGIVQPFTLVPDRGIKDFASLYAIDEPSTEILLRNAQLIVEGQTAHEIKDGQFRGRNDTVREFVALMDPALTPTRKQLETAAQLQFRMAIGRDADAREIERLLSLYEKCAKAGDRPSAARTMLQAVLLRADAMFRSELGGATFQVAPPSRSGSPSPATEQGRGARADDLESRPTAAMLAPADLARAVSLALGDRREPVIMQAAAKGELATREQVAAHVRRILDDPKWEKPRLLRFFRQYFEYDNATEVFKDKPKDLIYDPRQLVADTDRLVLHILAEDKDVFRRLLTTDESFVNFTLKENKQTRKHDVPTRVIVPNPHNNKGQAPPESYFGLSEWTPEQPIKVAANTRIGILMQPSWLAAWSTNFDNDPVRRGRWIRERLLGGTVPDLPIGVAAQVPDAPHHTFRSRLRVTREAECWKCHQRMDELGLPFENFDHYGRFRITETVRDLEATQKNVDKKGKPLGPVNREAELVTTGTIADSGDASLDGPVRDPRDMLRKIAGSARARQVFIRHVFRYYLGRNESMADARTLQAADRAYVESGGSFKALLVSLLTSDAFLLRQRAGRWDDFPSRPTAGE